MKTLYESILDDEDVLVDNIKSHLNEPENVFLLINKKMRDNSDEIIVNYFKPHFDSITFYSWLREPDFCNDYEQRWNKDNQISVKDEQIKSLVEAQKQIQNLLDQQQRLALQDKKLLEEYKAENDSLKALKMPSQETEFKHLDNQYKDEVNALKEKLENLQEQIKDQKRIEEQEKPRKWWELWRK